MALTPGPDTRWQSPHQACEVNAVWSFGLKSEGLTGHHVVIKIELE